MGHSGRIGNQEHEHPDGRRREKQYDDEHEEGASVQDGASDTLVGVYNEEVSAIMWCLTQSMCCDGCVPIVIDHTQRIKCVKHDAPKRSSLSPR